MQGPWHLRERRSRVPIGRHALAARCDDGQVTEDAVFDGVLRLVSAGEFQDLRYVPARFSPEGLPRHVRRGTAEYVAARDAGLLEPIPPLIPASPAAVAEAEKVIGFPLPPLLRRLYLEVGNGRFGPDYGIRGVDSVIRVREDYSPNPNSIVPPGLIWIHEWGCDIWSLVDCRDPAGRMWAWDGNRDPGSALIPQDQALTGWLALWLECRRSMPTWPDPASAQEPPPGGYLVRLVPAHPRLVIPLRAKTPDEPAGGTP